MKIGLYPMTKRSSLYVFKRNFKTKLLAFLFLSSVFNIRANTIYEHTKSGTDLINIEIGDFSDLKSISGFELLLKHKPIDLNLKFTFSTDNVSTSTWIDNQEIEITGYVRGADGIVLPGASVIIVGTTKGAQTDFDGNYKINAKKGDVLRFSYIGMKTVHATVGDKTTIDIVLEEDTAALDEIVIVGFGSQKRSTIVGAISTVKPSELKIPSSNLTTALAGRLSGVISYQTSGEPGANNAQFFVRGVASFNSQNGPLILIDGVELTVDDLARLQPDDIESFSVLKDPTTTAIYGARGANGIIMVTTKQGKKGKPKIRLRIENAFSRPVSTPRLADPYTYIKLQNQAARDRGGFAIYTESQVAGVRDGLNKNVYPTVDWYQELFKDYTTTQRVNLNVSGGGDLIRYYVAGSLNKDNGIIKVDPLNSFNNNISIKNYSFRSNINIDLHENTEMILRISSTLDDYTGPLDGGNNVYSSVLRTSPVRFPAVFQRDETNMNIPYILFGNSSSGRASNGAVVYGDSESPVWNNPYAALQRGYKNKKRQSSSVQLEFKQKLDFITPGLSARFLGNINALAQFENRRSYNPYFYEVDYVNPSNPNDYSIDLIGEGGRESLSLDPSYRENSSVMYVETAINYTKTINEKHTVSGLLVGIARDYMDGQATNVELSLPSRNLGISGRFSYAYDDKYFVEFDFGYNGSERFAKNNRFGFFPSMGVGWLVSNEEFFKSSVIDRLKLRYSYGLVGNDQIGNTRNDRFFYLSSVNLSDLGRGYIFGQDFDNLVRGIAVHRYANPKVTWELAEKSNLGVEISLLKSINLTVDAFYETRSNILQDRQDIPSTLGLAAPLKTNIGEVNAWGIDGSIDFSHSFTNDFWMSGRATYTYSDNKFTVFEEPNYDVIDSPWRSNIGNNVTQMIGFIAERLFIDDDDAINSPTQLSGTPGIDYGAGDIKYKDLNKDGRITDLDRTAIGNPTVPKITYGFGLSAGYKRFDISLFFQGLSQTSFQMNYGDIGPFFNVWEGGENALLQEIADNHWTEENNDPYAKWPKLSLNRIGNNNQSSTFWLRDGSFLRLKQVEIGYDFLNPDNKIGLKTFRVYVTGTNLHSWSKFKLWDPELKERGYNYPLQEVINIGLQLGF